MAHAVGRKIVAGALSSSAKIAYLSEPLSLGPWVFQIVNSFALGVKAANPKATVFVRFLPENHWELPDSHGSAARELIAKGCDFFGGMDSVEVMETLNASTISGKRVHMFQKDLSYKRSPNVIVSGPIRDFADLFEKPLLALKDGTWKAEEFYPPASSKFGGGEVAFNPAFLEEIRSKKIKTADLGVIGLLDLIDKRAQQLAQGDFEPFTGPIKDQKGKLRLADGIRAEWSFIESIDWLVDNVEGNSGNANILNSTAFKALKGSWNVNLSTRPNKWLDTRHVYRDDGIFEIYYGDSLGYRGTITAIDGSTITVTKLFAALSNTAPSFTMCYKPASAKSMRFGWVNEKGVPVYYLDLTR